MAQEAGTAQPTRTMAQQVVASQTAHTQAARTQTARMQAKKPAHFSQPPEPQKKGHPFPLAILKWLVIVATVAYLAISCAGVADSQTDFSTMSNAVTSAANLEPMQQADNQMIRRLYGIDPSQYAGVLLYYPSTNMGAEELLLVQLSNDKQADDLRKAIDARIEAQKKSFNGYGEEQYAMLEKSVVIIKGNYALLIVANDTTPVVTAFNNAYAGGAA